MAAIAQAKEVVPRWSDYRAARDTVFEIYGAAYRAVYGEVQKAAADIETAIRSGAAYASAPADKRDGAIMGVFGPGGPCYFPAIETSTLFALLAAAGRASITSLAQAGKALPSRAKEAVADLANSGDSRPTAHCHFVGFPPTAPRR
jgi:hypothetical protein